MEYENSIKNIFLPLNINHNCQTQKNINIYKNMGYSNYLTSLPKVKNKKYNNITLSLLKTFKNNLNLNLNHNSTSPYMYRQIITQYKNSQKTFSLRNDNNLQYNYTDKNIQTGYNNNNEEKQIDNKIDLRNIPKIKKISLRSITYDKNYQEKEKEIKNLINDKKENDDNNDIKTDKWDRLSTFNKFRNNNIKKRNIFIKKSETYNKVANSNEKNNYNDKYDFQTLIKNRNNKSSYKNYCINKYTPKLKKNKNEDIIDLLNIKE